jgi:hypothetical protein
MAFAVCAVAAVLMVMLVAATAAQASFNNIYCGPKAIASGDTCVWGVYHHLQTNHSVNYYGAHFRVCAGAKNPDGSNHGSFYCDYAISPLVIYNNEAAYAAIHNGDPGRQTMEGQATG